MSHLKVIIDGDTVADGDLGQWTTNPPDIIADQLKPHAHPKPWMRALLLTIADAAMTNANLNATIHTTPNGWSMEITQ